MPGGSERTFVLFLCCLLTGSRRVWYCCLQLEEPRNRRVQLRFGHSGLKVTGLSFLACVRSVKTLMFSLLVAPDALSWERRLSPSGVQSSYPSRPLSYPGASNLSYPHLEWEQSPFLRGTLLWLLHLPSRTFCTSFSTSIPSLLLLLGLTDSSNLLHQALVSLWYLGGALGCSWKSGQEETRKGGTRFWMKVKL